MRIPPNCSAAARDSEGSCFAMLALFAGSCASRALSRAASLSPSSLSCSDRSEEHTSELQSLMRISYAVFCLKKKNPWITVYLHLMFININKRNHTPQVSKRNTPVSDHTSD